MSVPALVIASLALVFTVASFWWLHARVGTLRAFAPTTFSAHISAEQTRLIVPVMLANSGPVPIVVLAMRLRFEDAVTEDPMTWDWTRSTVDSNRGELVDGAALFSVGGRSTHAISAEFVGVYPGRVPEPRPYAVALEALTSKSESWTSLTTWQLQAANIKHPSNYIMYTNDPGYLATTELAEAAKNLAALKASLPAVAMP